MVLVQTQHSGNMHLGVHRPGLVDLLSQRKLVERSCRGPGTREAPQFEKMLAVTSVGTVFTESSTCPTAYLQQGLILHPLRQTVLVKDRHSIHTRGKEGLGRQ